MNCNYCDTKLRWEGDNDVEGDSNCDPGVSTHYSCPECPTTVVVVHRISKVEQDAYIKGFEDGHKSKL
tara:strand:+ start:95 stop:298 length:204 start_codon:yes stop_codon:yes gene_type:complete